MSSTQCFGDHDFASATSRYIWMRCVRASNVPHTSEQKVHSTFNCGSSQATTRVLVVKTGIEVLRQKSKSIRGQTERTRRHLRNDYRLTDGQKTSRNIDPMRLQQICFGYSRLACSPSMLHIQDRQSNQRAAKRLSEPCNIYRRAGYNGVFEPHLGNIVWRDSNGLNDNNEGVCRRECHIQLCFPIATEGLCTEALIIIVGTTVSTRRTW